MESVDAATLPELNISTLNVGDVVASRNGDGLFWAVLTSTGPKDLTGRVIANLEHKKHEFGDAVSFKRDTVYGILSATWGERLNAMDIIRCMMGHLEEFYTVAPVGGYNARAGPLDARKLMIELLQRGEEAAPQLCSLLAADLRKAPGQ